MSIKISKDVFFKTQLLFLLLIPIVLRSVELNIIFALLISVSVLFTSELKLSKQFVFALGCLCLVFVTSLLGTIIYRHALYDIIKDLFYFLKPILFLLLGYYLSSKIKDRSYLFKVIINTALIFSVLHLYTITNYFLEGNIFNINKIRSVAGKANYLEMLAVLLMLVNKKNKYFYWKTKFKFFFKLLIIASFLFYFSRTAIVALVILLLSVNGYLKLTKRGVLYISLFIVATISLYTYLFSIKIERDSEGFEGFLYKLKIAPVEIFNYDIDVNNHAELWDQWRGYEAYKAINQTADKPYGLGYVFGQGLGSLIDLGFKAPLNNEGLQYISSIHNGYIFVYYKTGIIGLLLYLIFLLHLYMQGYRRSLNKEISFINNLISGFGVYFIFTSLIITGVYNHGEVITLVVGCLFFVQKTKQGCLESKRLDNLNLKK